MYLVNHGDALLAMFADKGHKYTADRLTKDGVELLMGLKVTEIGPGHVKLSDDRVIRTRTVIWGGGLMAAPVAGASGLPQGRGGRIDVQPDFTVAGFPGVLAIGDFANIPHKDGKTYPQLGSVALQSGGAAAKTILADLEGKPAKPFHYLDKGTMAMIGRGAAIAQVPPGVELHGKLAFAAWLGVHAALMTGGSNRVDAFKSWAVDFFGKERAPQALDRSGEPRMTVGRRRRGGSRARSQRRWGMTDDRTYDVIIIGSGAGGGTLAGHLAPSGKRILLLERGDWLPREIENWDAGEVFVKNRYVSKDTWYDDKGKGFQPGIHYYVGGQTKFYGAALYRLRREDFGELKHHDGISPAWPISYEDLEPYYSKAEQLYEVHGSHDEDPTEPPSSTAYPFPAVSHEPRIQQLSDDLERAGFHPFHAPCGIRLHEEQHAVQPVHPLRHVRRLPVARPGQVRRRDLRCPACPRASERHARHERQRR